MDKTMKNLNYLGAVLLCAIYLGVSATASAATIYSNGFETDIAGWDAFGGVYDPTRVPSGTNGITSASGAFHAESSATGSAGNWGGYNYGAGGGIPTVFQEYTTSIDIYLDLSGGWANDTRFDFTSAINGSDGNHLRDFAFNGGFYDSSDVGAPGAGTDRFVFSASNTTGRANSYPQNPGRDPVAISASGWYTFEHHFYEDAGILTADLNLLTSGGSLVNTWTLADGSDLIAGVGGNRYGWFASNEFSTLAFDNTSLEVVPIPAAAWLFGSALGLLGWVRRRTATTNA